MNHGCEMASGGVAAAKKKFNIPTNAPAYLLDAIKDVGTQEWVISAKTKKKISNPAVERWIAKSNNGTALNAISTPWCAYYVGAKLMYAGWPSTNQGMARSYLRYGNQQSKTDDSTWRVGDIVVLWRGTRNDGVTGHVGFLVSWTATRVTLLGGNQGDKVSFQDFPRTKILGVTRPKSIGSSKVIQGTSVAGGGVTTAVGVDAMIPDAHQLPVQNLNAEPMQPGVTGDAFPATGTQLQDVALPPAAPSALPDPVSVQTGVQQIQEPLSMLAQFKPWIMIALAVIILGSLAYVAYYRWRMRQTDGT